MNASILELKQICAKKVETDFERNYRKVSIYFSWLFIKMSISANQTSVLMLFAGLSADLCFLFPSNYARFLGAVLFQFYIILDYVDGDIARYAKIKSFSEKATGKYFDLFSHYLVHPSFYFCLGYGLYLEYGKLYVLIVGFVCGYSFLLVAINHYCRYKAVMKYSLKKETVLSGEIPDIDQKDPEAENHKDSLLQKIKHFINMCGTNFFIEVVAVILLSTIDIVLGLITKKQTSVFIFFLYFMAIYYTVIWIKVFFTTFWNGIHIKNMS